MFERREQIRTQASLLLAHSIEIPALEQKRKKTLSEILCLLRFGALSPHEGINGPPVSAAKFFKCFVRLWRFALRGEDDAPMSGGKSYSTALSDLTNRPPRRPVINGRHATIQLKSRTQIKPPSGPNVSIWSALSLWEDAGPLLHPEGLLRCQI